MSGKLFLISAPSGGGKTSLTQALLTHFTFARPIKRAITYTSRTPRVGEVNGCDYYFLSEVDFQRRIDENFFIEWSTAYGAYYGSPRYILEEVRQGSIYIMTPDRTGAQAILQHYPESLLIWIWSSETSLQDRLIKRNTEDQEQRAFRLKRSVFEAKLEQQSPIFHYYIINDVFDRALNQLAAIIQEKL